MADGKISALVDPIKSAPGIHYRNPRFPLQFKLPDNLEVGTKIYIHGAAATDANRFAFNLKNAEVDGNNYFHFNARFDEGCVVRNSRVDEAWGDEERDGDMPFIQGEPFLITITPTVDCYEIEVNGSPFINFNHRDDMPLCDVTHISMWGDIVVYGIHVPLNSMPIPLVLRIPKHAYTGDALVLKGQTPPDAGRFHVNFQCGDGEDADIMYHFNPRFGDSSVICNHRCADAWGDEESLHLPVPAGEPIKAVIGISKEAFTPFVGGEPLPTFAHRLEVSGACSIFIDGDIRLECVTYDCAPIRLPPQVPDIDIETFEDITVQALNATNPVLMALPGVFGTGKAVYISGRVSDEPDRFQVNLQCGDNNMMLPMHFNPRWDGSDGPVLVLNSLDGENWGEEMREPNPIEPGSEVEIYILCLDDAYQILINGDLAATFPHRLDVGSADHVTIQGSITVHRILGM